MDDGLQGEAQLGEVGGRPLAEDAVEHRVVGIVAGAHDQPRRLGARADPVDDLRLAGGEVGQVAAHVVEQDGEVLDAGIVELGELGGERHLGGGVEAEVQLERRQAHAEADVGLAAGGAERLERVELALRIGLAPPAAEIGVGLGRIEPEAVAAGAQEADVGLAVRPAPGPAEEPLDDTDFHRHGLEASGVRPNVESGAA
ncbi:hypothetical protein LRS04_13255 [Phenylobacterium sp. J367]|nr:hypothetical protein [Phenylobacterium sp. J367]MCR5879202.1 hypothetical protein [Phenylobacterium sp. J367]